MKGFIEVTESNKENSVRLVFIYNIALIEPAVENGSVLYLIKEVDTYGTGYGRSYLILNDSYEEIKQKIKEATL